jgi:signal transduction histidine kinase
MAHSSEHVRLPMTRYAPRRARTWAERVLDVDLAGRDLILLMLSELVSNSVRYSGGSIDDHVDIDVKQADDRIHVEVRDPGPGLGIEPGKVPEHSGLRIVDSLSDGWGVRRQPTTVWFDVTT